jgi:hypothetical protein
MKIYEVMNTTPAAVLTAVKPQPATQTQTIQVQPDAVKREQRIDWVMQLLAKKGYQQVVPSKGEILLAFKRYDEMQRKANADYAREKERKEAKAEWDKGCAESGTDRPLRR